MDRKPDDHTNEEKRQLALAERCNEYRTRLQKKDPQDVAARAAMSISQDEQEKFFLCGEHLHDFYYISWPDLKVTDSNGNQASLNKEILWLHYLDRSDGFSLAGRWVNLSEIGGLFYQQAFQGYSGDELAAAWGDDLQGLREKCLKHGGWEIKGLGDLSFEWRLLPRVPVCICYRLTDESGEAWATVLFDASANHYIAADVAAVMGKELTDALKPDSTTQ